MERAFIETFTGRPVRPGHGFLEQLTVDREED
jgi:hypothetical protein